MSSLRRYPLPLVFSLSALLFPSLFFLPAPYYHLSFSFCTALKLFGSIISTLQRTFSRSLSTYQFRLHCFASSWLPGGTREHELLIKFHSFLASLFFLGFLNRTLIARESRWLLPSSATRHRFSVRVFLFSLASCSLLS